MRTWGRLWDGVRVLGHALFYAVMFCVFVSFIVMGIIGWVERDRPVYWGNLHRDLLNVRPRPPRHLYECWTLAEHEGTIVKDGVTLDGVTGADGVVRASYQPGGLLGDDENNIVHTETWSTAGLWFPWAASALTAGAIWDSHRRWRRVGGKNDRSPFGPLRTPSSQTTLATTDTRTFAPAPCGLLPRT